MKMMIMKITKIKILKEKINKQEKWEIINKKKSLNLIFDI